MTPGARVAAAIEIIAAIAAADRPADETVEAYVRARRYMGGADRRAVGGRVFALLRHLHRLDWHLARAGAAPAPRTRALAGLLLVDGLTPAEAAALFSGDGHAPAPLAADEAALAEALAGRPLADPAMPDDVALEYPAWLDAPLRRAFGPRLPAEMAALNAAAPLDLRVNTLKGGRDDARRALAAEGVAAEPTPLSPLGLRVAGRTHLPTTRAFRDGLVEVQDEGSQIVALLADARGSMTVVDFCAGAGGKTLALAAAMRTPAGGGVLWALDVERRFLDRLAARARRAGAAGIRRHALAGVDDPWIAGHAEFADRVLVDAPCGGSGTWRRHPGAKAWLTPERLADLVARQDGILAAAAGLMRPGGRLVYATCSLLAEENENRVEAFLGARPDFAPLPVADVWSGTVGGRRPAAGPWLRLSPAATGTDGFFCAILERNRKGRL